MPPTTAPAIKPPRVYIVDDDAAVRSAVSMLVGTCGWEAMPCANADEFFNCYTPGGNQCLILDLRMPGRGGDAVQSELARRGDTLPIILVTAHNEQPEARLARSRGAVAVFGKPFDSAKLLECLRQTLADEAPRAQEMPK